jgi:hypothetical protein
VKENPIDDLANLNILKRAVKSAVNGNREAEYWLRGVLVGWMMHMPKALLIDICLVVLNHQNKELNKEAQKN